MRFAARHNPGMVATGSLTELIRLARAGDAEAVHRIFDATYPDLRRLAHLRLSQNGRGMYLDTTALVHESYLRFVNAGELRVNDRQHFMAYAANVMRSVIVDFARERLAERRGGGAEHVTLDTRAGEVGAGGEDEIVGVHEALENLAKVDARMSRIVEMRYFGGMTEPEIAEALGITDRTVRRDWEKARLLLAKALAP
jgi:RNA polymerase sigma factor (TIGR02999 family)